VIDAMKTILKKLENNIGNFVQVHTLDGQYKGRGDLKEFLALNDSCVRLFLQEESDDYIIVFDIEKDTIRIGNLPFKDRMKAFELTTMEQK
jgi:hypothetical protein